MIVASHRDMDHCKSILFMCMLVIIKYPCRSELGIGITFVDASLEVLCCSESWRSGYSWIHILYALHLAVLGVGSVGVVVVGRSDDPASHANWSLNSQAGRSMTRFQTSLPTVFPFADSLWFVHAFYRLSIYDNGCRWAANPRQIHQIQYQQNNLRPSTKWR